MIQNFKFEKKEHCNPKPRFQSMLAGLQRHSALATIEPKSFEKGFIDLKKCSEPNSASNPPSRKIAIHDQKARGDNSLFTVEESDSDSVSPVHS